MRFFEVQTVVLPRRYEPRHRWFAPSKRLDPIKIATRTLALMLVLAAASASVEAGVVRSANSVTQTAGARSDDGLPAELALINQSGLETRNTNCHGTPAPKCNVTGVNGGNPMTYTSGVTDWDTYFAAGPTHTSERFSVSPFTYFEWYSGAHTSVSSLRFDFGSEILLSGIAIWNEEFLGVNTFGLRDGNGATLLTGQSLTDNSYNPSPPYGADVFTFTPVLTRYLTLDLTSCTQVLLGANRCSLGEVAFRQELAPVPAPAPLMMVGLWMVLLGAVRALPRAVGR